MFILTDATGIGSDDLDADQASVDLAVIANDTGLGVDPPSGGSQLVTYAPTLTGTVQLRLDDLVNTTFTPDYGSGPSNTDIVIIAGLKGFVLDDGTPLADNGFSLAPASSGLPGSGSNTTENCLVAYDTSISVCVARDGTGGTLDLGSSTPVVLYHELSHAFRIVSNATLSLTADCDPSSPEERAAILDENDLRADLANRAGTTPELRDPDIHCATTGSCDGGCCIIATVASKSLTSPEVNALRSVRDQFVRKSDVGFAFFERFFHDYYAFSPQVCTIMASQPDLPGRVRDGFVAPLLDFWMVMVARSESPMGPSELGAALRKRAGSPADAEFRLSDIRRIVSFWLEEAGRGKDVPDELVTLLQERAWSSEHIQWSLVSPVRIYGLLLESLVGGASDEELGLEFERQLDAWAPELPLSQVWAGFPYRTAKRELAFCDRALLHSGRSRSRFRSRLRDRFRDITSIQTVTAGAKEMEGAL